MMTADWGDDLRPAAKFNPSSGTDLELEGRGDLDQQERRAGRWVFSFTDGSSAFVTYEANVLEGPYGCKHADGLVESGTFSAGVKNGTCHFYLGDRVVRIETWRDGKLEGPMRLFNPETDEVRLFHYVDDKPQGEARTIVDGKLVLRRRFESGRLAGLHEAWWDDGETLAVRGQYEDGEQHGEWRKFDRSGRLASTQVWEHGTLISEVDETPPPA